MPIPTTATEVLSIASRELGTKESPSGSNKQKYGEWAGRNGVAWCAIFVTWVFARAGFDWRGRIPGHAYTPTLERELRAQGFVKVDPYNAKPGDVVFFDFPDSVNRIQHVGIVEGNDPIHARQLITLEGNTSQRSDDNGGEVQRRYRPYRYVKSILRPPYTVPAKRPTRANKRVPVIKRVLKYRRIFAMRGEDVKLVQALVGAKVDGAFGPKTSAAVKAWQRKKGLYADGEFGPRSTRAAGWVWGG